MTAKNGFIALASYTLQSIRQPVLPTASTTLKLLPVDLEIPVLRMALFEDAELPTVARYCAVLTATRGCKICSESKAVFAVLLICFRPSDRLGANFLSLNKAESFSKR